MKRVGCRPILSFPIDGPCATALATGAGCFEITVTVALLVVTSTIVDGYRRTLNWDFGFDPAPLLVTRIAAVNPASIFDLEQHLSGIAGILHATATTAGPGAGIGTVEDVGVAIGSRVTSARNHL